MKTILILLTTFMLLMAQPAFAIDLQSAKQQGLVGEVADGYLEAVDSPSAEVKALIKSVNDKRREIYKDIAARNNTSLKAVEELAGKKAIEKSEAGSYVKTNGSWLKK